MLFYLLKFKHLDSSVLYDNVSRWYALKTPSAANLYSPEIDTIKNSKINKKQNLLINNCEITNNLKDNHFRNFEHTNVITTQSNQINEYNPSMFNNFYLIL